MSLPPITSAESSTSSPPIARVKSPPLAFERTPNDALSPPIQQSHSYGEGLTSSSTMGRASPLSPPASIERHLQAVVDQQATALRKAHEFFAEERKAWELERRGMQERIARLEQHIRPDDHWSPAKSPVISPSASADIVSPSARAAVSSSLPTIAEDENFQPLSARRENAPGSIELPSAPLADVDDTHRKSSVSFNDGVLVEEIILSPGGAAPTPPAAYRVAAGYTPIRAAVRPPTPPPQEMSIDGIEDTPTRHNTHLNTFLIQSRDEEEDRELKGPLMMPELPSDLDETNFTLDALSKKLEHIQDHPEQSKPMIFCQPSPGLASPASEKNEYGFSPRSKIRSIDSETPCAPIASRASELVHSELSSNALSPAMSNGGMLTPQEAHDAKVQAEFEQGGIRLKKKTSVNFGAPFGSLGGFGLRRPSQDKA